MKQDNLPLEQMTERQIERLNDPNTPPHVKEYLLNLSYPEYTEEDKKRGMNEKDLDFMTENPMLWGVILPSIFVIGFGLLPFITMFIFFDKPEFLKP
mgnify:FL=1